MTATADAIFRTAHVFNASRERVWAAWTTPDLLARWFGPKGCETVLLDYDLRPGGAWFARMDMEGAPPMFGRFIFREVAPRDRLVWVHGFADPDGNRIRAPFPGPPWPVEMLATVTFTDHAEGTRVTLAFEPIAPNAEERDTFIAAMDGLDQGWGGTFAQLDALLDQ